MIETLLLPADREIFPALTSRAYRRAGNEL